MYFHGQQLQQTANSAVQRENTAGPGHLCHCHRHCQVCLACKDLLWQFLAVALGNLWRTQVFMGKICPLKTGVRFRSNIIIVIAIVIIVGPDYKKILRLSYDVIITYDNRKSHLR